jgi:hypothetical protein
MKYKEEILNFECDISDFNMSPMLDAAIFQNHNLFHSEYWFLGRKSVDYFFQGFVKKLSLPLQTFKVLNSKFAFEVLVRSL